MTFVRSNKVRQDEADVRARRLHQSTPTPPPRDHTAEKAPLAAASDDLEGRLAAFDDFNAHALASTPEQHVAVSIEQTLADLASKYPALTAKDLADLRVELLAKREAK